MPRSKPGNGVKKLSLTEKAKILAWRSENVSATVMAARLGRHRSSIKRLLASNMARFLCPKKSLKVVYFIHLFGIANLFF
jgi:hypothetical protein